MMLMYIIALNVGNGNAKGAVTLIFTIQEEKYKKWRGSKTR